MSSFLASFCFREPVHAYIDEDGTYQSELTAILAMDIAARSMDQNKCAAAFEIYKLLHDGEIEKVLRMPSLGDKGCDDMFASILGFSLIQNMDLFTEQIEGPRGEMQFTNFTILFWWRMEQSMDDLLRKCVTQ